MEKKGSLLKTIIESTSKRPLGRPKLEVLLKKSCNIWLWCSCLDMYWSGQKKTDKRCPIFLELKYLTKCLMMWPICHYPFSTNTYHTGSKTNIMQPKFFHFIITLILCLNIHNYYFSCLYYINNENIYQLWTFAWIISSEAQ